MTMGILGSAQAQTNYYWGTAQFGEPVEVDLSALEGLGPAPNLPQLLHPTQPLPPQNQTRTIQPLQPQSVLPPAPASGNAPKSSLVAPVRPAAKPASQPAAKAIAPPPKPQAVTPPAAQASKPAAGTAPSSGLVASQPKIEESAPAKKAEPAKPAAKKIEPAKVESAAVAPKKPLPVPAKPEIEEPPKPAAKKVEPAEQPKPAKVEPPKPAKVETAETPPAPAKVEPTPEKVESAKVEPAKQPEPAKVEPPKPAKVEPAKVEAPKAAEVETPPAAVEPEQPEAATEEEPAQIAALDPNLVIEQDNRLTIKFPEGVSDLPAGVKPALDKLATRMEEDGDLRVQLLGYAAAAGESPSQARRMSLFRALSVRTYLMKKGVRSTRMDVRALGNKVEDGSADRVDIVIPE